MTKSSNIEHVFGSDFDDYIIGADTGASNDNDLFGAGGTDV